MKNLFFILFIALISSIRLFSQSQTIPNSYIISGLTDTSKLQSIKNSIENADFEKYRAKTKSVFLEFRDNFTLELIPAEKLAQSETSLNISNYSDILPPDYIYPLFKIDNSGILVTMYKAKVTKIKVNNSSK
ncbi:MAG: hypothetical protein K9H41_09645 [Bacteroidia bacterium]|nr:hypothetical protein [Bacteroidia bacterium]